MRFKDIDEAINIFQQEAKKHDNATRSGKYKIGNSAAKRMIDALKFIWKTDPYVLSPLLADDNDNVKLWTAMFWLEVNEEHALQILNDIANTDSFYSFSAQMTISEWEKGNLTSKQWE